MRIIESAGSIIANKFADADAAHSMSSRYRGITRLVTRIKFKPSNFVKLINKFAEMNFI